jgi:hypothetical protein
MNQGPYQPYNNQQPPYGQPPYPGQFQPPQPPPLRQSGGFRQWLNTRTRGTKFALGCGTLFIVLLLCMCSLAAYGSTLPQTNSPTPTTSTANNGGQSTPVSVIATDTATVTLDSTPTPSPTPTDTPIPTPTPSPTSKPVPTPAPRPTLTPAPKCVAVNNNPWCYDFNPGNLIYVPPSGFCNYFACISSFYAPDDPGDGYIVECSDGSYSQSGGESGACSYHGGVMRPLYSH